MDIWQDLLYALRTLRKSPAFTLTAVLTLALGIGANTAIFSMIQQVLLKPLSYPEPDRLAYFSIDNPGRSESDISFAPDQFEYLKANQKSFEAIGVYGRPENLALSGDGEPELLKAARVSANFLEILRIRPTLGRGFQADEDVANGPSVALISSKLFARRFSNDPGILHRAVIFDGKPHTIVGVLPEGFEFPYADVDVWIPRPGEWSLVPTRVWGKLAILTGFWRLKTSANIREGNSELGLLIKQFAVAHPSAFNSFSSYTMKVVPLRDRLVGSVQAMLWLLFGAAAFVLLIACANLASLFLSRGSARAREFAIRAALGASRLRLAGQLLLEGLVLASIGGVLGVFLAHWILAAIAYSGALTLAGSINAPYLPGSRTLHVDGAALAFTAVAAIAAALLFGLWPALRASRPSLTGSLRATGAGTSATGIHARDLLIAAQIAFSVILLIGAGLLLRSFVRLSSVAPGFNTGNLLCAKIALPLAHYDTDEKRNRFFENLVAAVETTPGVKAAAMARTLPTTAWLKTAIGVVGKPAPDPSDPTSIAVVQTITPGYFRALTIPLKFGREFTPRDNRAGSPPVAIVNETMARKLWPGYPRESPLGSKLYQSYAKVDGLEVVGVVGDIHEGGLASRPVAEFYLPSALSPPQTAFLAVKTEGDPMSFAKTISRLVWAVDPAQSIADIKTMDAFYASSLGRRRLTLVLIGSFGAVALLLALVGVYGLIDFTVRQRTPELGIRRALGATSMDILQLILGRGLRLAVAGGIAGLCGAWAMRGLLQGLLFEIRSNDLATFVSVFVLFVAITLAGSWRPAQRASKIDPMTALRSD